MNIKEAKTEIKNAMTAYFAKDETGSYLIPIEKQRPVFLVGPPGIGKTAIMEQIASEMGVGLLSYSMTHHTRQSALGLPFISRKKYGNMEFDVSEYTMSEIISSVYEIMENSGVKEGILFLDEINCVSETLSPIMLQFLQYKIFGRHRVPDGWMVVTAGNPLEYNKSARDFDIATSDRLKRIEVEPDFATWKEYAYTSGVHPAIITYLDTKKENFYSIKTGVEGKSFATARGWEDLSRVILVYEKTGIEITARLIVQYVQNKKIASDFAAYYSLFEKYKNDYKITDILNGTATEEIKQRAGNATFDERLALIGLILDSLSSESKIIVRRDRVLLHVRDILREYKMCISGECNSSDYKESFKKLVDAEQEKMKLRKSAGIINSSDKEEYIQVMTTLEFLEQEVEKMSGAKIAFDLIRTDFDLMVTDHQEKVEKVKAKMTNAFTFFETVYSDGQEMLVFITEITANYYTATYISKYGCNEYFKHSDSLMFGERSKRINKEIEELEI